MNVHRHAQIEDPAASPLRESVRRRLDLGFNVNCTLGSERMKARVHRACSGSQLSFGQ